MAQISNSMGAGGFSSSSSIPGIPSPNIAPTIGYGPADYLRALILRGAGRGVGAQQPYGPSLDRNPPDEFAGQEARKRALLEDELLQTKVNDAQAQSAALSAPAPTKMVSGPGIVPGPTEDPLAMNAYQREAYEPARSGGPVSGGATLEGPGVDPVPKTAPVSSLPAAGLDAYGSASQADLIRRDLYGSGGGTGG